MNFLVRSLFYIFVVAIVDAYGSYRKYPPKPNATTPVCLFLCMNFKCNENEHSIDCLDLHSRSGCNPFYRKDRVTDVRHHRQSHRNFKLVSLGHEWEELYVPGDKIYHDDPKNDYDDI